MTGNLGWAAQALIKVADNPFAVLALLLIVISSVAITFFVTAAQTGAKLAAFIILSLLFLFLMGFALTSEQSQASLDAAKSSKVEVSAVQASANKLNDEITKRDALIAQLNARLAQLSDSTGSRPAEKAERELQESIQNSHCSGPISKAIPVSATPGWKIVPDSVRIVVLFSTGNSKFEGPTPLDPTRPNPDLGFKVTLEAANSGACGPKVFGQRIGLDGRGRIGVAIRYTEESNPA